ncbi:MAG: hypothetical protein ACRD4P_06270 [Bryobacteraceae bacterium]
MVGTDGMKISVGDASVQVVTMPGHTPGTLSYLFEVRDNGKPLRIAYAGGTAIPGEPNPFEAGADAVARYFSVVQNCVAATNLRGLARVAQRFSGYSSSSECRSLATRQQTLFSRV